VDRHETVEEVTRRAVPTFAASVARTLAVIWSAMVRAR